MSEHSRQSQADAGADAEAVSPRRATRPQSRVTFALLDAYTAGHETRGYDPYDTASTQRDAWAGKPKRA